MWTWLKKRLPTAQSLQKHRSMRLIGGWFRKRPYLWKFTKHSVSSSIAISIFVAFLPLPLEMLIVTLLAILFHANLPIAILSTWITNPFTLIPANYFSYKVGEWILWENDSDFVPLKKIQFDWHNWSLFWNELTTWLGSLGKAYLVGLPIVSISVGLISYSIVYLIWTGAEWVKKKRKK